MHELRQSLTMPLTATFQLVDQIAFGPLVLLTIVFRAAVNRLPSSGIPVPAAVIAAIVMPLYFLHCYARVGQNLECLILSLIRAFLFHQIAEALLTTFFLTTAHIFARLHRIRDRINQWRRKRALAALKNQPPLSAPLSALRPTPPPLPRTERMRRHAQAAQDDFNAELAVLQAMPLDDDEREILILQSKQRLLESLSKLNQA